MSTQASETLPEVQFNALMSRHPLGIGTPEDVAYAIAFLLTPAAKWVTGTALVIDGGTAPERQSRVQLLFLPQVAPALPEVAIFSWWSKVCRNPG